MTKKVLMLKLVDQVDNDKSLNLLISQLLLDSKISNSHPRTYKIEFDYYKDDLDVEEVKEDSDEMAVALQICQVMIDSINDLEDNYKHN